MKEKILKLLENKFQGTRKDGLSILAGVLSLTAQDEETAQKIIDNLDAEGVKQFITDYRRATDSEITKANKTAEENLRQKFDFVEKGKQPEPQPKNEPQTTDISELLKKATEPILQRLSQLETERVKAQREGSLKKILNGIPESVKNIMIENFSTKTFESEEAFSDYLKQAEETVNAAAQEYKAANLPHAPKYGNSDNSEVSAGMKAFIAAKQNKKSK